MVQTSELEQRVVAQAAAVHAAQAALAESLAEFATSGEWEGYGIASVGHWADINLGISSRKASRLVDTARQLRELPLLRRAFLDGSLSLDKVQAVAEVASPRSERRFTKLALLGSTAQVLKVCREYRKARDRDDPDAAERRIQKRRVTVHEIDDSLIRLTAVLEKDEAALVLAAIDRRVEANWRHEQASECEQPPAELGQRRADALVELAAETMDLGPDPIVAGDHIEVRVNVDAELLTGVREDGICNIEGLGSAPLSVVRTLCCDAKVTAQHEHLAGIFDLGRTQRTANRAQRRCLRKRDGGCRYPGCPARRYVQVHHAVPWEHDGPTDIANLLELCPKHHRLFHAGSYQIDVLGNGKFEFRRLDGKPIQPPPRRAKPGAGPPPSGNPRAEGQGERMNLGLTVDALIYLPAA